MKYTSGWSIDRTINHKANDEIKLSESEMRKYLKNESYIEEYLYFY